MKTNISKRLKTMVWDYRIGLEIGSTKCPCCGDNNISQSEFHCGHIEAESEGGNLDKSNLIPICCQCNLSMSTTHMRTFMLQQFGRKINDILDEYKINKKVISKIFKIIKTKKVKDILAKTLIKVIESKKSANS